jgi:hypothetical protein
MFVVMALVTTFATTPIVKGLYPPWYQKKLEAWKRGEIDWDGKPLGSDGASQSDSALKSESTQIRRLLVYLRLDSLPSIFTFISLLGVDNEIITPTTDTVVANDDLTTPSARKRPLEVHALRILELTERTSSVMKVTEGDEFSRRDPVVNTFRTFSQLNDVAVSSSVVVAPEDNFAETVVSKASDQSSDFVLIPWSEIGSNTEDESIPFKTSNQDRFSGKAHLDFILNTLSKSVCNTGIFIGNGFSGIAPTERSRTGLTRTISGVSLRSHREAALPPVADKSHHVFLPFIGGEDDRVALHFVLQLARNPLITATIAHLNWSSDGDEVISVVEGTAESKEAVKTEITAQDSSLLATLQSSLPKNIASRVSFTDVSVRTTSVLTEAFDLAKEKVGQNPRNAGDIIVVGRRHAKLPVPPRAIGQGTSEYDMGKTVGVLGEKFALGGLRASVLIVQAAVDKEQTTVAYK